MTGGELLPIVKLISDGGDAASKAVPSHLREAVSYTLADVWNGLIGDKVAAWRIRNVAQVQEKLEANLAGRSQKLDMSKIPERFAFGWFEEASKQDEPEIQELFAKLLENAACGNSDAIEKRNLDLASKLNPSDALLIKHLAEWIQTGYAHLFGRIPDYTSVAVSYDGVRHHVERHNGFRCDQSFENLINYGIAKIFTHSAIDQRRVNSSARRMLDRSVTPDLSRAIVSETKFQLSLTGVSLMTALGLLPEPSAELA
jgi:hypothetical protein